MPRPSRKPTRIFWMTAALACAVALVGLAFWSLARRRIAAQPRLALPNPDAATHESFGRSVAWGSAGLLIGDSRAGRAWLFDERSGEVLARCDDPSSDRAGLFGEAVAAAGSLVAVGAPLDGPEGARGGAVYVFDGGSGVLQRRIANPSPSPGALFGARLAADATRLLVGAPRQHDGTSTGGAAYLFEAASGRLLATFRNPGRGGCVEFGRSLALGEQGVLVGAPYCSEPGIDGTVTLFDATSGRRRLTVSNPRSGPPSLFGGAVAFLGDELLVAARDRGGRGAGRGAVYLFEGERGRLRAAFENPEPERGASFGEPLAVLPGGRFAAAAPQAERVYVFGRGDKRPLATLASPSLTPARGAGQTLFGTGLAARGASLLVAAPCEDATFALKWRQAGLERTRVPHYEPASTGGSAYVYDLR